MHSDLLAICATANALSRDSRRIGAPLLTPDASVSTRLDWLRWCDANGDFDGTETWEIIESIVTSA